MRHRGEKKYDDIKRITSDLLWTMEIVLYFIQNSLMFNLQFLLSTIKL